MSEDAIDALLRRALDVEPSPKLMARVRARIAAEAPARSRWVRWSLSAVAAAAAVALGVVARRPPEPQASRRAPASAVPLTVAPPSAGMHAEGPTFAASRPRSRLTASHRPPAPARPSEPEVLVESGQEEALLRLAAALHTGHLDARALMAAQTAAEEPLALPKDIEIPPLETAAPFDRAGTIE